MTRRVRTILGAVVLILGLSLMAGGIIADRNGAVVVGLCSAVAACIQLMAGRTQASGQGGPEGLEET